MPYRKNTAAKEFATRIIFLEIFMQEMAPGFQFVSQEY